MARMPQLTRFQALGALVVLMTQMVASQRSGSGSRTATPRVLRGRVGLDDERKPDVGVTPG